VKFTPLFQFIDDRVFARTDRLSITIEESKEYYCVLNNFIVNQGNRKLIRYFGSESNVIIPRYVEIVGERCFSNNNHLLSISFEYNSFLGRIESQAFAETLGLSYVRLPPTVIFIAADAFSPLYVLVMESCSEFNHWVSRHSLDRNMPFQQMKPISEWVVDLRSFKQVCVINTNSLFPFGLHEDRVTGLRML
jgi:hypothetical protein